MPFDRKHYTKLLKQNKVKRSEINRKKNAEAKRSILRDLIQWYNTENLSRTATLKLVRKHGLTIPAEVRREPFAWAGIKRFGEKEQKFTRRQIGYIKRLKPTTIPREDRLYGINQYEKGHYVYIVKLYTGKKTKKGKAEYKSVLIETDELVSSLRIERAVWSVIETGDFDDEALLFETSPELIFRKLETITRIEVSGIMKGTK